MLLPALTERGAGQRRRPARVLKRGFDARGLDGVA